MFDFLPFHQIRFLKIIESWYNSQVNSNKKSLSLIILLTNYDYLCTYFIFNF